MLAGGITSADAAGAHRDDAAFPSVKHARTSKEHNTPKGNKAGKGPQGGKGGGRGVGTRGKAKMLADESRFSRPHPLQVRVSPTSLIGFEQGHGCCKTVIVREQSLPCADPDTAFVARVPLSQIIVIGLDWDFSPSHSEGMTASGSTD